MSDSPTPGNVINVNSGGDLKSALNNAHCGDVIQLQAGATFSGQFQVPAKNCDVSHWIADSHQLFGQRFCRPRDRELRLATPASVLCKGVRNIVARAQNVMAKVQLTTQRGRPVPDRERAPTITASSGLEVTRPSGAAGPGRLITDSGHGGPHHRRPFVVARSGRRMKPTPGRQPQWHDQCGRSSTPISAISIASPATGHCTDSHAISGGMHQYTGWSLSRFRTTSSKRRAKAFLFGGGAATLTPSDIQILNNHFWKPWQWMPGNTDLSSVARMGTHLSSRTTSNSRTRSACWWKRT